MQCRYPTSSSQNAIQQTRTNTTNPHLFALASICTDGMVRAMMLHLPLHQLETLVIEHLTFKDDIPIPRCEHFLERSPSLPYTMRFLASLTSLKHLHITEWGNFLQLLNYPGPAGFAYLPKLETLRVEAVIDDIFRFLKDRVQVRQRRPLRFEIGGKTYGEFNSKQLKVVQEMINELAQG